MSTQTKLLSILVQTGFHGGRNIPVMLEGEPGIAKTQVIFALGDSIAKVIDKPFPVEVFVAPQRLPEDVGGLPVPDLENNQVRQLPLSTGKKLMSAGRGIFFVDEYSSANQAMGGACMTMIQDHRLGDNVLPQAVAMVAAMNPADCAANGRDLTPPESNRFCFIRWKLTFDDWADYMQGGEGATRDTVILPPNWEKDNGVKARSLIVSFLKRNSSLFDIKQTMPKSFDASKPWASPRSWENASRVIAACLATGHSTLSDVTHEGVRGCVGDGAANQFVTWVRKMDLPDPEEVLKNADKFKFGKMRSDKVQAILEGVATVAQQDRKERKGS